MLRSSTSGLGLLFAFVAVAIAFRLRRSFSGWGRTLCGRFYRIFTQRHTIRFAGQLQQHRVIECELCFGVPAARITIRHQQRNRVALRHRRERGQKIAPGAEHGGIFSVVCIGFNQAGVQFRTSGGIGKTLVKQRHQLGGA